MSHTDAIHRVMDSVQSSSPNPLRLSLLSSIVRSLRNFRSRSRMTGTPATENLCTPELQDYSYPPVLQFFTRVCEVDKNAIRPVNRTLAGVHPHEGLLPSIYGLRGDRRKLRVVCVLTEVASNVCRDADDM